MEDTWWDSENHYIITQADTKLEQILEDDQDLFFSNMVAEVEMGSISHQVSTKMIWPDVNRLDLHILVHCSNTKSKDNEGTPCKTTNKAQPHTILDQVSVMTGATLLEQDINTLLECLLNAMQAKKLINPSNMAAGSQKTGETKWDPWPSDHNTSVRAWYTKKATRIWKHQQCKH